MECEIKKRKGIDNLISGYSPQEVEEENKVIVKGESLLQRIIEKQNRLSPIRNKTKTEAGQLEVYLEIEKLFMEALSPEEIAVLPSILNSTDRPDKIIGKMILSRLLRNSYLAGNNGFCLSGIEMDFFGKQMAGTEDRFLKLTHQGGGYNCFYEGLFLNITAIGHQGTRYGCDCKKCVFYIDGNSENSLGSCANQSSFTVTGDIGTHGGRHSYGSRFCIGGEVGTAFAAHVVSCTIEVYGNCNGQIGYFARESEFILHSRPGKIGKHCTDCTFKTPNKDTLQILLRETDHGNKVVFIKDDGEEDVVREGSGSER